VAVEGTEKDHLDVDPLRSAFEITISDHQLAGPHGSKVARSAP
jgi:hypothetical protein